MEEPVILEVFSDYVCPFCWLAEPALHELKESEPDVQIVWRSFELRPEPVPTLDPEGEYLERVWTSSVYPLAEQLGIQMRLPPLQPRSRLAHEAAHWARAHNCFDDYNAALFRAFFERGEDIGNTEVLVRLAADTGLDGEALRRALGERSFEADVLADEKAAVELGISGVPAFVADKRAALSGVQTAERLAALVRKVRGI